MNDPLHEAETITAHTSATTPQAVLTDPAMIGRYRIVRRLGQGGFGRVYLAHDDELDRPVAIKVPNPERIASPEDIEAYLAEARTVARLDHPSIVPVHDVGRTSDGLCYVVSKYIEGTDLAAMLGGVALSHRDAADLVATVAEALHHAHTRGLVHRDVKPANILIDASGRAILADFGLALKDEDFGKGPGMAGTPAYMSPEQARGEGHRVDGRSDIFSLGVVLYELLTRRRPFRSETRQELLDQIATSEARPPRQIDDMIPKELERICLKALSKRASERYSTARDQAEDLRLFLQANPTSVGLVAAPAVVGTPPGSTQEVTPLPPTSGRPDSDTTVIKVVPKGLRSFDEHDADFFLELLPGARDRDGLPESLRFWKSRIEERDADKTFKVGLIYGPSGCGKSSLVKAGLIPRLTKHVHTVYVEASAGETEARLLRGLRRACPDLSADRNLVDAMADLRRGRALRSGQKVLLVIDQFEQWLYARRGEHDTELVTALRQCDGEHVQAVVMVRDDFWLAASRFMRDLEIRLLEGENSALVDLFDPRHAMKVLTAFGRAYGALAEGMLELTVDHKAFIDQSISGLAQDGKVISVRLALFAEMVNGKTWTPATLREVGGTHGVGVTFLEETFSASTAPPEHRLHQKAAQAVLKALLPATGIDIKGEMRSEAELREASGYGDRPSDFDDLIRILDAELRLITPTDPEGSTEDGPAGKPIGGRYYQFTHDYLVPSLREWLTRKQRETPRGRAELRLSERSATWNAKPESRHLPSVVEWATARTLTRRRDWTEPQRRMMMRAGRVHGMRAAGLATLLVLLTWGGIEVLCNVRAAAQVNSLKAASTTNVPPLIGELSGYRRWANPRLVRLLRASEPASRDHLHASLALLPVDRDQVEFLYGRLLESEPEEFPVLRDALEPHSRGLVPRLWSVVTSTRPDDKRLLAAASALARYDPTDSKWEQVAPVVSQAVVAVNPVFVKAWIDALKPVRSKLAPPLATVFRDKARGESEHNLATTILAVYVKDEPGILADLLTDAEPKAYSTLLPIAEALRPEVVPIFQSWVAREPKPTDSEEQKDQLAERQARAAISLVRMGKAEEVWPLLRHSTDPRLRSFIVNWLSRLKADPSLIVAGLERIDPKAKPALVSGQYAMESILFHPETSMRRALILALGTYGTEGLSASDRGSLGVKLLDLYRNDPDAGIHGSAGWTLRQWGQGEKIKIADAGLMKLGDEGRGDRRWYVNGQGQTFILIEGPVEFSMGSPSTETDRNDVEVPHRVAIPRRFAIATTEVTVEQYRPFARTNPTFGVEEADLKRYSPDPSGPIVLVTWYGAAAYCNWLSEREGIPKVQWCYEPNGEGVYGPGMTIPADVLRRNGYRLPTEAEWEYACRAGATTSRYYGRSPDLLGRYSWYNKNSGEQIRPCGNLLPSDLGEFDMLGNAFEWNQGRSDYYRVNVGKSATVDIDEYENIKESPRILRGGAFNDRPSFVRSASRLGVAPSYRFSYSGFRPSRTYP